MIFRPQFVELVLAGRKTQTRRPVKFTHNWRTLVVKPCAYAVGKTYAVQPGRGKHAVARIRVLEVTRVPVNPIDARDAVAEGFASREAFLDWWRDFYGDTVGDCWRIRFELA